MTTVFGDTFYWIALTMPTDPAYERALQFTGTIVTTDEVLTEYLTFFSAQEPLRRKATTNAQKILRNPSVRVIRQSRESLLSGLKLYAARPDKGYSLTDCISMQTMRREGLTEVLPSDQHLEQEGFRLLLRNS